MQLQFESRTLHLRHPFIISGSQYSEKIVFTATLMHEGIVGRGESSPSRYYGEPPESVQTMLSDTARWIGDISSPADIQTLHEVLLQKYPHQPSARSCVIMAAYDWLARSCQMPLYRLWGLNPHKTCRTSFTIGMDEPDVLTEKVKEAEAYPVLKIKLGNGDEDYTIMQTIRRCTDKTIRVDANEGWQRDEAIEKITWLATQNVEYIEQPLPKESLEDMVWLKARSPLPLIADENVMTSRDIPGLHHAFHGINLKLDKCGGMWEALRMIQTARALDMKIMIGCMVSTSLAMTAAAHLTPLTDEADLDGHLLIRDDPFRGVTINHQGQLILPESDGIGVTEQGIH